LHAVYKRGYVNRIKEFQANYLDNEACNLTPAKQIMVYIER